MRCEWTLGTMTAEAVYDTGTPQVVIENHFNDLFRRLMQLHASVPLSSFTFVKGEEESEHVYRYVTKDGRVWTQHLFFSDENQFDPGQTFDVTDRFRVSEFAHHRALREHVVKLHGILCLTKFEATFI